MIAALLLAAALQGSLAERYDAHECDEPQNQADMNACAAIDFERADAELNQLWRRVIADAREDDRALDGDFDQRPSSEAVLREAQRAWIVFRDAHCTLEGYREARGGSMETMVYEGCRARLTRERIAQLAPEAE